MNASSPIIVLNSNLNEMPEKFAIPLNINPKFIQKGRLSQINDAFSVNKDLKRDGKLIGLFLNANPIGNDTSQFVS